MTSGVVIDCPGHKKVDLLKPTFTEAVLLLSRLNHLAHSETSKPTNKVTNKQTNKESSPPPKKKQSPYRWLDSPPPPSRVNSTLVSLSAGKIYQLVL